MKLSQVSRTRHFGGSQPTETFLDNYLAVNCEVRSRRFTGYGLSYCERALQDLIPSIGGNPNSNTIDIAFGMEGIDRSMACIRLVYLDRTGGIPWKDITGEEEVETIPVSMSDETYTKGNVDADDKRDVCDGIEDDYREDIDSLKDILSCITVPVRDTGVNPSDLQSIAMSTSTHAAYSNVKFQHRLVLSFYDDHDMKRHLIGAKNNLKEAAIRMTRSAAWRGITFPIDTRICQIELLSGQFFHQGVDLQGNPVLYFRNMCCGLWRKDINASTLAVLHRLERAFTIARKSNPEFQCTLVILMGKPKVSDSEAMGNDSTPGASVSIDQDEKYEKASSTVDGNTEKRGPSPPYHVHTNFTYAQHLINTMSQNYPERLGKVLVVPNGGWEKFIGVHGLRRYLKKSSRTISSKYITDMGYVFLQCNASINLTNDRYLSNAQR